MTATITTIQTGLKTAIEALTLPLPFTVRIQESDVAELPAVDSDADIVIGFESSQRLARTDATILEQFLVPITTRLRTPSGVQSEFANLNEFVELLRDGMADYHTADCRVDQLLAPHPYDAPQANSPGIGISKFVLDMDVLRRMSSITQDVTTPVQILSKIRQAVWNSLNNWSEWDSSTWVRKFQSDSDLDELALHDPAVFEIPAIAVTQGPTNPRFFVHTAQEWPATVNIVAWFPIHKTTLAEYRAQQIVRAMYQCCPPASTVSYIRAATGRIPEKDAPITLEAIELGRSQQLKALKLTCSFTITGVLSPLTD